MLKSRIPWGLALVVERLSGASSIALVLYGFYFSLMPWPKDDLPSELQAADGACRFLETTASLAGLGHA